MRQRRHRVEVADRVKPTPETVAKLKPDPLWQLDLDTDQEHAANEINRICKSIYGKTMVHLASLERFEHGVVTIPDALAAAHSKRFVPWSRENTASGVRVTLKIVVDREPVNGEAQLIRTALTDYARRYK